MTTDTPEESVPVASDATNGERKPGLIHRGSKLGTTGFKASRGCCSGFCDFLLSGNVVQLAVAFVIAQATVSLVNALVSDIITPLISAIFGGTDFSNLYFTVHHSRFMYGDLANYALSFLVICLIVYFLIVLPMNAAMRRMFPNLTKGSALSAFPRLMHAPSAACSALWPCRQLRLLSTERKPWTRKQALLLTQMYGVVVAAVAAPRPPFSSPPDQLPSTGL